jgi:SAM-dependent methyltransferase
MASIHSSGFTAHNVRLDDGTLTFPEAGRTIDQTGNYLCVKNLLPVLYPQGWAGRTLVDLGCLEGGFATEFARLGLAATGIDVRESNIANAEFIRSRTNLPQLKFIVDDAWNVARHGPFDIVFCVGLHYHIEDQHRFLAEMGRACTRAIFIDTYVAPEQDDALGVKTHSLSPLDVHEGLPGRWYHEHDLDPQAERDRLEQLKWASWDNRRSFWPTRVALVKSMRDAGFTTVLEDFDHLGEDPTDASTPEARRFANARSMFVGLKPA